MNGPPYKLVITSSTKDSAEMLEALSKILADRDGFREMCRVGNKQLKEERAENERLKSQLSALTPKPERFDPTEICTAARHGIYAGCCCGKVRMAYERGWRESPELDRAQVERLIKQRDEQRERIAGLEAALRNARQALMVPADECLTWQRTAFLATAAMRSALAAIDAALASPPKPEPSAREETLARFAKLPPLKSSFLVASGPPKPAAGDRAVHQCCGCSCHVCASGHNENANRTHTEKCKARFFTATGEQPKPDAGPCAECVGVGAVYDEHGICPRCNGTGREPSGGGV